MTARAREAKYPIRVVARMTGLPIDTLRAWERRHQTVAPLRDDRGRMYSEADVERLCLLRDAVAQGHAIGRVAKLDDGALRELATSASEPLARSEAPASVSASTIVRALDDLDLSQLDVQLARAAALMPPTELLRDVLLPAMREIGEHWHTRSLGMAQEHLLSGAVRNLLGSLLRVHARLDAPGRLLFATPGGERHEFGTLGSTLIAASSGLGATYLGPDLPAANLVEMASVSRSAIVVLGITLQEQEYPDGPAEVRAVAEGLPPQVELWLGGPGADAIAGTLSGRAIAVPDYDALRAQLTRAGGRF